MYYIDETEITLNHLSPNATGQYIYPFVLFRVVGKRDDFLRDMPPDIEIIMTEKGWVNEEAFRIWLQQFNRYLIQANVIEILDGHKSHMSY